MKKLITILLLSVLSLVSYSQTKLDMLVMEKINNYRVENGVAPLVFDSLVWKACNHHSVYLSDNGYPFDYICDNAHEEKVLINPSDRMRNEGVVLTNCAAENVNAFLLRDFWNGDEELIAQHVFNLWTSSPEHNNILLHSRPVFGAVSVYIEGRQAFCTLNVYK